MRKFLSRRLNRSLQKKANHARDRGDWAGAANGYAAILAHQPQRSDLWVQYGHAQKEMGQFAMAEVAYRRATEHDPDGADGWLNLGHARKMLGENDRALEAFAQLLRLDPQRHDVRDEMQTLGGVGQIPEIYRSSDRRAEAHAAIRTAITETRQALARYDRIGDFPIGAYDAFRHAYPIVRAPQAARTDPFTIMIDARATEPWRLRATMDSLSGQHDVGWNACILCDPVMRDAPVASRAACDGRFVFYDTDLPEMPRSCGVSAGALLVNAGWILHPETLAWFRFAAERTGAATILCDEDQVQMIGRGVQQHSSPVLRSASDCGAGLGSPQPLAMLYVRKAEEAAGWWRGTALLEDILDQLGRPALLARILLSEVLLPPAAIPAPAGATLSPKPRRPAKSASETPEVPRRPLTIIIPTRDHPELLKSCVESLFGLADAPDRLRLVIVDNRSVESKTHRLFKTLRQRNGASILAMDEPFNWSRANNLAVAHAGGEAQDLLFVNNDIEIFTRSWDKMVRRHLGDRQVGILGARLTYPDGGIQHGGIILGMNGGLPVHEGVGMKAGDHGPDQRWIRNRNCAAVTGAFMAMRSEMFHTTGGFDEVELPVGYNDIDMCLAVRRNGHVVRYLGDIAIVHHESKSRGLNVDRSQIAWDQSELEVARARWGDDLDFDAAYHPHWNRRGRPFEAYREPGLNEIVEWLDRTADADVWKIRERVGP